MARPAPSPAVAGHTVALTCAVATDRAAPHGAMRVVVSASIDGGYPVALDKHYGCWGHDPRLGQTGGRRARLHDRLRRQRLNRRDPNAAVDGRRCRSAPGADGMLTSEMASAEPKLATYSDLLALPADVRGEVLAGEVVTAPAPLPRHSKVQGAARRFVGGPFDDDDGRGGPGGWWIFVEVDVSLGPHDIVRPDLAGLASHAPAPAGRGAANRSRA
jgi:hypothetical protein